MKKKGFTFLAALLIAVSIFGQSPEKISYQAVVRDATNATVANQVVGMQISILQDGTLENPGSAVYVETQTPTTNANGLLSIYIGGGTAVTGTFSGIAWSNGPHYIKIEIDPSGDNTNYTITGTTQLVSVPFAQYSKTAGNVSNANGNIYSEGTLKMFGNPSGQGSSIQSIGDVGNGWRGRIVAGDNNTTFLMGTYFGKAWLGAHSWSDARTGADAKWSDFYVNPDGDKKLFLGSVPTSSLPIVTIDNSNGKVTITDGTQGAGKVLTSDDYGLASWADAPGLTTAVNAIVQIDGNITITTTNIPEGDNMYYTEARVSGNADVLLNKLKVGQASGTTTGDMQYWNGTAWVVIATTLNEGAVLQMISGVPTWIGGTPPPPPAIGDLRDGGVVFWVDGNGGGLVCALEDYQSTVAWGCFETDLPSVPNVAYNGGNPVGAGAEIGDGESNTSGILTDCSTAPAALAARSYGAEWFLPSAKELDEIYINKATLEAVSGVVAFSNWYWSSTEVDFKVAWGQNFGNGTQYNFVKASAIFVRAVRAF